MTNEYLKLENKIHQVRRRMRWILFAKGLAISLALTVVILVIAGLAADYWNYSAATLALTRVVSLIAVLAVFGWFLVRRLVRRVPDAKLARYIEERHPEIQDRLVSAIELGQKEGDKNPLLPLLYSDAFRRIRPIEPKTLFNPREPLLSGLAASCLVGSFALLQLFGPDFLNYATLKLYADWLYPQPQSIYAIEVLPGDTQLRKGSDQRISARLMGFDAPEVTFYSRYESSGKWEKSRMEPEKDSSAFGFLFLDLNEKVHYYVQAGNVRSPEFAIEVRDVPQVETVNLIYHYPAYTGLPDRTEEDTGDIVALQGTRVEVEVKTNVEAHAGNLSLPGAKPVALKKTGDRTLRGTLTVSNNSSYKVKLSEADDKDGFESVEYSITVLEDQPPQVTVTKPGRDTKVTKLEEVLTEAKADDDLGLKSLELHFSVNGGKENVMSLFRGKDGTTKSMSGTHTFFLEEYNLQPGDFITYFARAKDAKNRTDSDIYFLEVRPFGKEYSQAQASGMQAGAGQSDTVLSARQKEILAATFRLIRDRKTFKKKEYSENLKLVAESQKKLQQEAKTLSERIVRRALTERNEDFQKLSENLQKAVDAMTPAHRYLDEEKPSEAMPPEQTALQHLMRAESFFRDIQVAQASSSGGAGSQSEAQELENLFELELDQLKNQYETLQQQQNRKADAQLDEARRKLQELARRQQQLNERSRQASSRAAQGGGGSPRSEQMQLQEEIQKLARQLERLSREKENEELAQASRRLQQAARDMQDSSQASQASGENQGTRALNRLNDARRLMDRFQEGSLNNDVRKLKEQAAELSRQQEQIKSDVEKLTQGSQGADQNGNPAGRSERPGDIARRIQSEKRDLKKGLGELQQGLHDAARKAAGQQKNDGSRDLQSTANYLKDEGLPRRIDQARDMIRRGMVDNARQREDSIQESLGGLNERMASAERSLQEAGGKPGSPQERLEEALNKTGDLVADLEAMQRRAREQQQGRPGQQQGQNGRQGQQDQPGQQAQRGEQGQQGQEGQQGEQEGQEGQQQGEQGQQGQQGQAGQEGGNGQQPGSGQPGSNQGQPGNGQQHAGGPAGGRDATNFGERAPAGGAARLTPDQVRQFEKEFQLRLREGQDLARQLRDRPDLAAQVQDILKRMKNMPPSRMLEDAGELSRLKSSVIDGFRQLELKLSRELNQAARKDNVRLAKDEDVPKEYRKQVEDYYRALAENAE